VFIRFRLRCVLSMFILSIVFRYNTVANGELQVPTFYYQLLFWIYWLIAAVMGGLLLATLLREKDRGVQATAAILLVPIILRLLLIK